MRREAFTMKTRQELRRREFLQTATAGLMLSPAFAPASMAQSSKAPVRFGLIGCGGRGRHVATVFIKEAGAQLVALGDLFEDQLTAAQQHFNGLLGDLGQPPIAPTRLYQGPDAHLKLASSDLDAVLIAVTPYYYPEIIEHLVPLGKHIYCEKPIATDVAGCLRVAAAAQNVNNRFTFHVGLQLRESSALKQMVEKIHAGAIGKIVTAQGFFYWSGGRREPPAGVSHEEARIRAWGGDRILSGDIMVEQNVHSIDKLNWVLQAHPIAATARGGRKARTDFGDIWDHFIAQLHYPGDLTVSFQSTQFLKGFRDAGERFFGTDGVSESHYFGGVKIMGDHPWDSGVTEIIEDAETNKTRLFVQDIQTGNFRNEAPRAVESTLSAILVRTAAYQRQEVTWDEVVSSNEQWDAHIDLSRLG